MSLPWFPFYADAYTGDTGHLTCEEHGAYLQLMIAYYRSEKPLPGTDRALAALVKLPMDRWLECKPTLEPFFRADGGFWHHDRIEEEMSERYAKHSAATDKAKVAAAARVRKANSKAAPSIAQGDLQATTSTLTLTTTIPPSGGEEAPPPKVASQDLGSEVELAFKPSSLTLDAYPDFETADIADQARKFVNHHREKGSLSNDWQASFRKWLDREVAFRAKNAPKKAPPRIEVDVKPDWDQACTSWVKLGSWPRGMGNDPSSPACRCPPEVLVKHGVIKIKEPTT